MSRICKEMCLLSALECDVQLGLIVELEADLDGMFQW